MKPVRSEPDDVTDRFDDVNAYDRLYRCRRGYLVKVRVQDRSSSPSTLAFLVTGSWAEDKTGKARLFDGGPPFIVDPHELIVRAESETDIAQSIQSARLLMVDRVSLAAANANARAALHGVRGAESFPS